MATPKIQAEDILRLADEEEETTGTAEIWVYDDIGPWGVTAQIFREALSRTTDADVVHLHIHSRGGSVFDAFAMIAALEQHSVRVVAYVDGLAASAASLLPMACDERLIARTGQYMIHEARAWAGGTARKLLKVVEQLQRTEPLLLNTYLKHVTWSESELRSAMEAETWLNAEESVEAGFAEKVVEPVVPEAKLGELDLSMYDHPPAQIWKPSPTQEPEAEVSDDIEDLLAAIRDGLETPAKSPPPSGGYPDENLIAALAAAL